MIPHITYIWFVNSCRQCLLISGSRFFSIFGTPLPIRMGFKMSFFYLNTNIVHLMNTQIIWSLYHYFGKWDHFRRIQIILEYILDVINLPTGFIHLLFKPNKAIYNKRYIVNTTQLCIITHYRLELRSVKYPD